MQQIIKEIIQQSFLDWELELTFTFPPNPEAGDLTILLFPLVKKQALAIPELAKKFIEALVADARIYKVEHTGGYLNIFFEQKFLIEHFFSSNITASDQLKKERVVVEFSGPNTNKPLHLGHMRNHALGQFMVGLLKQLGAEVFVVNIINDRGVHICKSMLAYQQTGENQTPEQTGEKGDYFVGRFYVEFEKMAKQDPTLLEALPKMLQRWEQGDTEIIALWKKMNGWTLGGHAQTYQRQNIRFDKPYYESDFYKEGVNLVKAGVEKGVFRQKEDGSIVVDLGNREKVLLRADGTSLYVTQDLAVARQRFEDFSPTRLIYVVADEQIEHFRALFTSLECLDILPVERCFHLAYSLVHLPSGRMKSREGSVVEADELMDQLQKIAAQKIQERHPELPAEKVHTIAEQIQNAAWRFYLLKTACTKSVTFNPEESINFQGASGPYLQYCGVRIRSLLKQAPEDFLKTTPDFSVLGEPERQLVAKMLQFPAVLEQSLDHYQSTYLVTFLLSLGQQWSRYYQENPILKAPEPIAKARLAIAQKLLEMLEAGLGVLGIEIPEQM